MTFADKVKYHRKKLHLTQTELGDLLGVKKNAVSKWECGRVEAVGQKTLNNMAHLFGVKISYLIADDEDPATDSISDEAHHIGVLYDRADEKDKLLTHSVLDKYEDENKVIFINTKKKNPGGFTEIDVYDEPAAAGLGNYLDEPVSHREQMPTFMVPKGADFGIRISGDSMAPMIMDGSVVFVKHSITVESGKVGIFVLNNESFCKQLIVDKEKKQIRLHSINPKYQDIIVTPEDTLITIGQILYWSEKPNN